MTDHATLLAAFDQLRDEVDAEFIGRKQEIDLFRVALVSGHNLYCLSDPGCGKTALYNRFFARIADCIHWGIQFSRHTLPDDLFGPLSVIGLTQDVRRRAWKGYLPEAHVALFDEFPRAAEATANGTLEVINEGTWNDDGQKKPLPLHIVIAAANTMLQAEHDGLGACADRFMLRCKWVADSSEDVLEGLWGVHFAPNPSTVITWAQVMEAHEQAMNVKVPRDVFLKAVELYRKVTTELGISISPRRWRECQWVIQALAWLNGRDTAQVSDLEGLAYCFWQDPSQIDAVERAVDAIAAPGMAAATLLSDNIVGIIDDVNLAMSTLSQEEKENEGTRILSKIKTGGRTIYAELQTNDGGRPGRLLKDTYARLEALYTKAAPELLGLPEAIPFEMFLKVGS